MKTIYCYCETAAGWGRDVVVRALCEDGALLAQHISSSEAWARVDIGYGEGSNRWQDSRYDAHCGAGDWRLVWVDDPENSTEVYDALVKNQAERLRDQETTEGRRDSTEETVP